MRHHNVGRRQASPIPSGMEFIDQRRRRTEATRRRYGVRGSTSAHGHCDRINDDPSAVTVNHYLLHPNLRAARLTEISTAASSLSQLSVSKTRGHSDPRN